MADMASAMSDLDVNDPYLENFLPYVYEGPFVAACIVPLTVATFLIGLRFHIRHKSGQGVAVDDWLTLVALVFCWATSAILLVLVSRGLMGNAPIPDNAPARIPEATSLIGSWLSTHIFASGFIKLSILFYWRRVFAVTPGVFNILSWLLIVACALWTVGVFLPAAVMAPHLSSPGYGGFNARWLVAVTATDMGTDTLVFILPIPVIWRLQMPLRKKMLTTLIFAIGSLSLIATVFRFAIQIRTYQIFTSGQETLVLNILAIYDDAGAYWSMVEIGVAIVALNVPALGNFFGTYASNASSAMSSSFRRVFGSRRDRSKTQTETDDSHRLQVRSQKSSESRQAIMTETEIC